MKFLTKCSSIMMTMALAMSMFTACSSDSLLDVTDSKWGKETASGTTLSLTVNTKGINSTTRAEGNGEGTTTIPAENKINRITVGVFAPDPNPVDGVENEDNEIVRNIFICEPENTGDTNKDGSQEANNEEGSKETSKSKYTFTVDKDGKATVNIDAAFLHEGDHVFVAVNAPRDKFQTVMSAANFHSAELDLGSALNNPAGVVMYGEETLKAPINGVFNIDIQVEHLLAKISLESLKVDFSSDKDDVFYDGSKETDQNSVKKTSFTPTEVFLINVPRIINFKKDGWPKEENYHQGWPDWNTEDKQKAIENEYNFDVNAAHKLMYIYSDLISKTFKDEEQKVLDYNNKEFGQKISFLTLPNQYTGNNDMTLGLEERFFGKHACRTKLVIGGIFKKDGLAERHVYYPISINAIFENGVAKPAEEGTDPFKVYANRIYKFNVTITSIGVDNPYQDSDFKKMTITATPTPFVDVNNVDINF